MEIDSLQGNEVEDHGPHALTSILIPTFNCEEYLVRCLQSAITQSYRQIEIVVQDNASTDQTWSIIEDFAAQHSQVKPERSSANVGPLQNWQRALQRCKGEFVKILWADDWMDHRCIEECIRALICKPDASLVFTAVMKHARDCETPLYHHPFRTTFTAAQFLTQTLLQDNMPFSPGSCLLRRRDAKFELMEGSSEKTLNAGRNFGAGPDVLLMLSAAASSKVVLHIPKFLNHFTDRPDNFTSAHCSEVFAAYREVFALFLADTKAKAEVSGFSQVFRRAERYKQWRLRFAKPLKDSFRRLAGLD